MRKIALAFAGLASFCANCNILPFPPADNNCVVYEEVLAGGVPANFVDIERRCNEIIFSNLRQGPDNLHFTSDFNSGGEDYQIQLFGLGDDLLFSQSIRLEDGTALAFPSYVFGKTLRIVPIKDCISTFEIDVESVSLRY